MAAAKGRSFLLYVSTASALADVTGDALITNFSAWVLVLGAQERSMTISNEAIDGTTAPVDPTDPLWQTQLAGAKSVTIECAYRYLNMEGEKRVLDVAWAEEAIIKALLVFPPDDTPPTPTPQLADTYGSQIFGEFLITSLSSSGGLSDTFNGSMTLASTGPVKLVHTI